MTSRASKLAIRNMPELGHQLALYFRSDKVCQSCEENKIDHDYCYRVFLPPWAVESREARIFIDFGPRDRRSRPQPVVAFPDRFSDSKRALVEEEAIGGNPITGGKPKWNCNE